MPGLVSPENLLVKLKKTRSSKVHQVVKTAETTAWKWELSNCRESY